MSKIAKINNAIQKGRGKAASVFGQSYNVYRMTTSTTNSVTASSPVISQMDASLVRYTARNDIEQTMFELLIFNVTADGRNLVLSDVLIENVADGGSGAAYIIGSMRPMRKTLAVRAEYMVTLSRSSSKSGSFTNQPVSGSIAPDEYASTSTFSDQVCTLSGGTYSFADPTTNPTPANIPCGLQPQSRKGLSHDPVMMPTQISDEYFVAYLPLLPGIEVLESDVIALTTPVGSVDRFEIIQVFTTNTTGFAGWILHLTKMAV